MWLSERKTQVVALEHARDVVQDFAELFGGATECGDRR